MTRVILSIKTVSILIEKLFMRKLFILTAIFFVAVSVDAQQSNKIPCADPVYRQFDFWLGQWEAFGPKGTKAGDSKISIILDSCVILEEWTSTAVANGFRYSGKSFNTYNAATKQWQQTWIDNSAGTTEFLRGEASDGKIIFYADKVVGTDGKPYLRRLTFTKLSDDKVRQFGERSDDGGTTWKTEYDLEYRRKK
jgi:hypothetical protein